MVANVSTVIFSHQCTRSNFGTVIGVGVVICHKRIDSNLQDIKSKPGKIRLSNYQLHNSCCRINCFTYPWFKKGLFLMKPICCILHLLCVLRRSEELLDVIISRLRDPHKWCGRSVQQAVNNTSSTSSDQILHLILDAEYRSLHRASLKKFSVPPLRTGRPQACSSCVVAQDPTARRAPDSTEF